MILNIAIEGIDNLGKTTVTEELARSLDEEGFKVKIEPEFGEDLLGNTIRDLVENHWSDIPVAAQPLLIGADRIHRYISNHNTDKNTDKIIIFDRHIFSTEVYQSIALKKPIAQMQVELQKIYAGTYTYPDLTFILDAPIKTVIKRGGDDIHSINFLEKARQLYLSYTDRKDVVIVNAEKSLGDIINDCMINIRKLID